MVWLLKTGRKQKNKLKLNSRKYLIEFFRENESHLIRHIKGASEIQSEENIHEIRVAIKKIRAFYKIIYRLTDNKFSEESKNKIFKKLFKNTGKLRDMQIKLNILENVPSSAKLTFFRDSLKKDEESIRHKIKNSLDKFNITEFVEMASNIESELPSFEKRKVKSELVKFILNSTLLIRKYIHSKHSNEKIHNIRKLLKEVHSASEILYMLNPVQHLKKFLKLIKDIEVKLGKWHDNIILLDSIYEYENTEKGKKNSELVKLETFLKNKNLLLIDDLIPEIEMLLNGIK